MPGCGAKKCTFSPGGFGKSSETLWQALILSPNPGFGAESMRFSAKLLFALFYADPLVLLRLQRTYIFGKTARSRDYGKNNVRSPFAVPEAAKIKTRGM